VSNACRACKRLFRCRRRVRSACKGPHAGGRGWCWWNH